MYRARINDPNRIYSFKGRKIRSPFEIVITEEEVKRFKAYINYCGITSFSIEKIVGEPIIDIEESVFETLIEKPMENIHTQVSSIELDPSKKEDSEIKIEELSLKSKSTLESFMNIELEKGK